MGGVNEELTFYVDEPRRLGGKCISAASYLSGRCYRHLIVLKCETVCFTNEVETEGCSRSCRDGLLEYGFRVERYGAQGL